MLDRLHSQFHKEQQSFLEERTEYGRALTGDSDTILATKFMNFLVHDFGKGCMLLTIKECTERLRTVGTIDNTFIAHEMIRAIRLVHCTNNDKCIIAYYINYIIIILYIIN